MRTRLVMSLCVLQCVLLTPPWAHEIHTAAREGDLDAIRTLLEADPALVNTGDDRQCCPLHFAADAGQISVMELLLNQGADVEALDVDHDTPLHWAAFAGQLDAVELLLERGAKIDARDHELSTPLLYAVRRSHYRATERLIERGANLEIPNDYGRTPLLWVARESGDLDMARLLLRHGANVNALDRYDDSPLCLAAWRGFRTLVDLFLDHGARVDLRDHMEDELLGYATEKGLERLYQHLINDGAKVDISPGEYGSLLHISAIGGSARIVGDLIDRGAGIDVADVFGWTPLHYAASRGRIDVVRELLNRGGATTSRSLSGYSALNLAQKRDATEVAHLLLSSGAATSPRRFPRLTGAYLGQGKPDREARPFAPDIVATPWGGHSSISFTPDGTEAYWSSYTSIPDSGYWHSSIQTSRILDGQWTPPEQAWFAGEDGGDVPIASPDGQHLFFMSERPLAPGERGGKENIWVMDRVGDGWGEPRPLPQAVNGMRQHWQFSVASNGDLYFNSRTGGDETAGLYLSRCVDGEYAPPEFLGIKGEAPFIAPDSSYLITLEFTGAGRHNIIRFRTRDGNWGDPIDITASYPDIGGMCPMVSPDGGAFFFMSQRTGKHNIFWVDAGFIDVLRAKGGAR